MLHLIITSYLKLLCLPEFMDFSPEDDHDWLEHVETILINILLNCVFFYVLFYRFVVNNALGTRYN
jgi:hypothetical protein